MNQITTVYTTDETFTSILEQSDSLFLEEVQDLIADCVNKYIGDKPRLVIRYSNDPSLALGRDPNHPLPVGTYFLNVFDMGDVEIVPGTQLTGDVKVFIVVDTMTRKVVDSTNSIRTLQ